MSSEGRQPVGASGLVDGEGQAAKDNNMGTGLAQQGTAARQEVRVLAGATDHLGALCRLLSGGRGACDA